MTKTMIYYFSGTGNSMAVAKAIGQALPDAKAVPILSKDALKSDYRGAERIGFVFPVYMNAVPKVVVEFIQGLKLKSTAYHFAIATHGGVPGMTALYLNKVFMKMGLILDAYYEIKMVNNTPKGVAPKFLMSMNWENDVTPDKVQLNLEAAKGAIDTAIDGISKKEKTTLQNVPKGIKKANYLLMSGVWSISERTKHKLDYILDQESCIGCGTCVDVCPTRRIAMASDKPKWLNDHCYFCYACFNFCPAQAIGVEHYTKKRGRYHHPDCSAKDISDQRNGLDHE